MSSHVHLVPHRPAARTAAALGGALLAATLAGAGLALDGRPLSVQTAEDGSFSRWQP